jgi:hypothetical protein
MADNDNLGKHFDDYVDELVRSGRYETRNDALLNAAQDYDAILFPQDTPDD